MKPINRKSGKIKKKYGFKHKHAMRYSIRKNLCKKCCLEEICLGSVALILKYAACAHFQNQFIKEHEMGKNTRASLAQKESQVKTGR